MSIFSALNGSILHFNTNAVPALNDIIGKINTCKDDEIKTELLKMILIADLGVDKLFNPSDGIIKSKVKSYDKKAFYMIYEMLTLFLISNTKKFANNEMADKQKEEFIRAINRGSECTVLWDEIDKFSETEERIRVIWGKIASRATGLTKEQEDSFMSLVWGLGMAYGNIHGGVL